MMVMELWIVPQFVLTQTVGILLSTTKTTYTVIAVTDASTIDTSSGAVLSGVTLKAPLKAQLLSLQPLP